MAFPSWLEVPLTLVTLWAVFFLLAWAVAREKLSPAARRWGWLSVAVAAGAFFWSFWAESLAPYLRAGRWEAILRLVLQVVVAVLGLALAVGGAVRFLRAWAQMGWVLASGGQTFLEDSAPFRAIRQRKEARTRWRMAGALMGRVLLLPGLGWVPLGVGLVALAFQWLEPDPSLTPDPATVRVALGFVALGLVQVTARWWHEHAH